MLRGGHSWTQPSIAFAWRTIQRALASGGVTRTLDVVASGIEKQQKTLP